MWCAKYVPHMNHVNVSPTDGNGPTQGQRKTLTRVETEPTTFGADHRRPTDWTTRPDGNWRCLSHGNEYVQVQGGITFFQTLAM